MDKNIFRAWDIGMNCYAPKQVSNQLFLNMDGQIIWHSIKAGLEIVTDKFIIEFSIKKKDKRNKLIFDGDIVSYGTYKQAIEMVETEGGEGQLICGYEFAAPDSNYCEIVGNIHQHKELLK